MSFEIVTKDATIKSAGGDEEFPGSFEVVLSSPTLDRDGDRLMPEDWKTPLPDRINFDSDHGMSVATTVGSGVPRIDKATGNLIVTGTFSSLPRAQDVRTLVREGHIDRTSVTFMTEPSTAKDGTTRRIRELLSGAFVALPSNREAVVLAAKGWTLPDAARVGKLPPFASGGLLPGAPNLGRSAGGTFIPIPGVRTFSYPAAKSAAVTGKAGARNAKADATMIQTIHDHTAALGATCPTENPSDDNAAAKDVAKDCQEAIARQLATAERKAIVGSLEAIQGRITDALEDTYPTLWPCLRGVMPGVADGSGTAVFDLTDPNSFDYDRQTYRQAYSDDGSVVSLQGVPQPVDIMEIVTPDADEADDPTLIHTASASPLTPAVPSKSSAAAASPAAATRRVPVAATTPEPVDDQAAQDELASLATRYLRGAYSYPVAPERG